MLIARVITKAKRVAIAVWKDQITGESPKKDA
jgi:hypothetical protein